MLPPAPPPAPPTTQGRSAEPGQLDLERGGFECPEIEQADAASFFERRHADQTDFGAGHVVLQQLGLQRPAAWTKNTASTRPPPWGGSAGASEFGIGANRWEELEGWEDGKSWRDGSQMGRAGGMMPSGGSAPALAAGEVDVRALLDEERVLLSRRDRGQCVRRSWGDVGALQARTQCFERLGHLAHSTQPPAHHCQCDATLCRGRSGRCAAVKVFCTCAEYFNMSAMFWPAVPSRCTPSTTHACGLVTRCSDSRSDVCGTADGGGQPHADGAP